MLEYSLVAGDHGMAGVGLVVWGNTVAATCTYLYMQRWADAGTLAGAGGKRYSSIN